MALDKQLAISKTGDAYLRTLLVGAAQYILGPFGPPSDLREHGLHLAARGGRGAKNKAVVAVARKLAVLMHALWSHESDYQPMRPRQKSAEPATATPALRTSDEVVLSAWHQPTFPCDMTMKQERISGTTAMQLRHGNTTAQAEVGPLDAMSR